MGQAFALLGTPDPRLNAQGGIDFRLSRQIRHYSKADKPPKRIKPIPFPILFHLCSSVTSATRVPIALEAAVDMIIIGTFFLMRPGEYCTSTAESHPFCVQDVALYVGVYCLNLSTASDAELLSSTTCHLTFTKQKNSVKGEKIGQGITRQSFFCPVKAVARRLIYLRSIQAPPTTPLHQFMSPSGKLADVKASDITKYLRASTTAIGAQYGLQGTDVDVRSLRPTGAMALLCAKIDPNIIRLIGRWKSDAMLRYLHVQALPSLQNFASDMLRGGHFSFQPTIH